MVFINGIWDQDYEYFILSGRNIVIDREYKLYANKQVKISGIIIMNGLLLYTVIYPELLA